MSTGPREHLSSKQIAAATMILAGERSFARIGEELGVSERTVYRWRQMPEFQAVLDGLDRERCAAAKLAIVDVVHQTIAKLQAELCQPTLDVRLSDYVSIVDRLSRFFPAEPDLDMRRMAAQEMLDNLESSLSGVRADPDTDLWQQVHARLVGLGEGEKNGVRNGR